MPQIDYLKYVQGSAPTRRGLTSPERTKLGSGIRRFRGPADAPPRSSLPCLPRCKGQRRTRALRGLPGQTRASALSRPCLTRLFVAPKRAVRVAGT